MAAAQRCPAKAVYTGGRCCRPVHEDAAHDYDWMVQESREQTWTPPSVRGRPAPAQEVVDPHPGRL